MHGAQINYSAYYGFNFLHKCILYICMEHGTWELLLHVAPLYMYIVWIHAMTQYIFKSLILIGSCINVSHTLFGFMLMYHHINTLIRLFDFDNFQAQLHWRQIMASTNNGIYMLQNFVKTTWDKHDLKWKLLSSTQQIENFTFVKTNYD